MFLSQISGLPPITATQEDEEEDQHLQYFGFIKGQIVGLRYYKGMVSNKEMVALVREPHNPYDRNAVRVNNILGEQVGHIKREMAMALAEIVDADLAKIEGIVPYGASNVYSMAVEILFFGIPTNTQRTAMILKKYGYHLITQQQGLPLNSQPKNNQQHTYTAARSRATRISADQMKSELNGLFEKLHEHDQTEEEEACPAIKSKLYPHQKQALAWMRKKESGRELPPFWEERQASGSEAGKSKKGVLYHNSLVNFLTPKKPKTMKGGILADDMGLGKTLVTISLIFGNSWNGKPVHKQITAKKGKKSKTSVSSTGTKTLLKVEIHRSEKELKSSAKLNEPETKVELSDDISVSTAATSQITQDLNAESKSIAVEENAGKRQKRSTKRPHKYVDELVIDLTGDEIMEEPKTKGKPKGKKAKTALDDEYIPDAKESKVDTLPMYNLNRSMLQPIDDSYPKFSKVPNPNKKPHATLIICPLSLIGNWVGQMEEHVYPTADVNIMAYHGPIKAQVTAAVLAMQDIVVTTYQTVAQEIKKSKNALLFKTNWLRVVLDEGHIIRNPKAQLTIACHQLNTEIKWVLTGTPIQNSTKDLHSIVAFLGVEPFVHIDWWRRTVSRPINEGDSSALNRIRCLLGAICLRRTKDQKVNGKPITNLPSKDIFLQSIDLDDKERELYDKMNAASKKAMKDMLEGYEPTQYADILVYLMRLRQICCHPSLAKDALEALSKGGLITAKAKELATKLLCLLEAGSVDDCCVCLDSVTKPVITHCSHVFCQLCICGVIANNIEHGMQPKCPLCRSDIKEADLVEPPVENEDESVISSNLQSSKVNALMFELLKLNRENPEIKSLVVSQFTEYLKIIQGHLVANNIPCVFYHGGMTRKAREYSIWQLQSGHAKVMLLTLKAGGVGLNLTAASCVFLMEPSWNPAAEDQCFDRVHRLGQTKPVRVVKFICKNTVEERMMEMQTRKRDLATASLRRRTAEEKKQQNVEDLRKLMDL